MVHDAAVQIDVIWSICEPLADKAVFESESIVGVRLIGVEVAELLVKARVLRVLSLNDTVLDSESMKCIFPGGVSADFGSPAGEILAIKEGFPGGEWVLGKSGKAKKRKRAGESEEQAFHGVNLGEISVLGKRTISREIDDWH